jgi:SAM-dependent methyltransferase
MKVLRLLRWPGFLRDYFELKKQAKESKDSFSFGKFYPVLGEEFLESGTAYGHYFHQDLLVANRVYHNNPKKHVDVGSRIDGFVAHVASFRQIEVFDVRPLENSIPNIRFKQVDLMSSDFNLRDYCDSVSSLHAIEHFGLGRYGEMIDYHGHLKGLDNIHEMLKKGGKFYFSAPIGKQRIEFNAHRVFSVKYLIELLEGKYWIDSFSYVNDQGDLVKDALLNPKDIESNYSCNYGCGIFELTKRKQA